jgi:hypothetical protein
MSLRTRTGALNLMALSCCMRIPSATFVGSLGARNLNRDAWNSVGRVQFQNESPKGMDH